MNRSLRRLLSACIAHLLFVSVAVAEPEHLSLLNVGVAEVDITPTMPIRLTGYASRRDEATVVRTKLFARAMAISASDDELSVLVTVDLLGVPYWLTEAIAERLKDDGVDRAHLAICGTHTHNGPQLRDTLMCHFHDNLPPDHQRHVDEYSDWLIDQVEKTVMAAIADRKPSKLDWGIGEIGFAAYRRKIIDGKWAGWGMNPNGPADHDLPVLRVRDPNGHVRAVLVSYACHCTTLAGPTIHADWAGAAAQQIQATYPGAIALVTIGCGGDANPNPMGGANFVHQHGKEVADEVHRLFTTKLKPINAPPTGRVKRIKLPFDHHVTREELSQRTGKRAEYTAQFLLKRYKTNEEIPAALDYPVQTWTFGQDLAMVFLAGEVVSDYSLRLKNELDASRLWVNAYANELPCYIASKRMLSEGGYEVDGSMTSYAQPTRLGPEAEDTLIRAVHELLPDDYEKP